MHCWVECQAFIHNKSEGKREREEQEHNDNSWIMLCVVCICLLSFLCSLKMKKKKKKNQRKYRDMWAAKLSLIVLNVLFVQPLVCACFNKTNKTSTIFWSEMKSKKEKKQRQKETRRVIKFNISSWIVAFWTLGLVFVFYHSKFKWIQEEISHAKM